jgi:hypothetical protein
VGVVGATCPLALVHVAMRARRLGLYPTPALEAAVAGLAVSRGTGRFIEEQAAAIWGFPKMSLVIIGVFGLAVAVIVVMILKVLAHG